MNSRFIHNTGIQHSTKLKRILAASVLIFHDAFLGIIVNEPSIKYNDTIHQTFNQTIISVPFEPKISDQTFEKFNKEVIDGFNDKNWLGVNIDKFGSGYSKRYDDSLCVLNVIYEQGDSIWGLV